MSNFMRGTQLVWECEVKGATSPKSMRQTSNASVGEQG
jgi:hypothetical protein